jgi:hypothetical protein
MRLLAAALVGCVVLVGCATESVEEAETESFADQIAIAIAEAEAGGAGDAQLAILRQAQTEGEISIEDARAAARAMVECVNNAGSQASYDERTNESGLVVPGYSALANTDEQQVIADACDAQEAFWINMIYQTQPASVAVNDAYLDQQAPLVRTCLEREGYATDPDATTIELLRQAADARDETDLAVDCLTEAKIDGF